MSAASLSPSLQNDAIQEDCVLVSWIARNNDPYERNQNHEFRRSASREVILGPSLTLLFDPDSPYLGKVSDVVLYFREPCPPSSDSVELERRMADETVAAIRERGGRINVAHRRWVHHDPTDHKAIYDFLESEIPTLRKRFTRQMLLIHISPGTPSMHTLWVLMAETGFIPPPFRLLKSYRRDERQGRSPVSTVEIGIPSLLKLLHESRPARVAAAEETVWWDRQKFQSPKLIAVYEEARRFARLKAPVLILGERGTGKTRLATWIRLHSPWRIPKMDQSWPSVPCGQYTSELMRAELFGYRKGAFTGANADHQGMLAKANGDTLFLDEIGDIKKDLQRLLIRAVEEHSYVRLGENEPKTSDFRLLTATNLPWEKLQQILDPDFLDRVSYFVLRLPALREIRPDLPWLWDEVFREVSRRSGLPGRSAQLGQEHHTRVVKALQCHPLPGNVRDLFRVAYHLLAAVAPSDETRMSRSDAVDYAITRGLESGPTGSGDEIPRAVCGAYARQAPLDSVLTNAEPLDMKLVERGLRRYLAGEIRRIARERGVDPKEVGGVTLRTLQNWEDGE